MSRTHKDVPHRLTWTFDKRKSTHEKREYYYDDETDSIKHRIYELSFRDYKQVYLGVGLPEHYHYSATPSWWTRIMMNRPQRRAGRIWERQVLLHDLEVTVPPDVSKKPHAYYW